MNYSEHADRCRRMAAEILNPAQKAAWISLAERWLRMGDLATDDCAAACAPALAAHPGDLI